MRQLGASGLAIAVGSVLSIAAIACYSAGDARWSYGGATGPAKWGSLEKRFAQCKLGHAQSPIDIPDASARK
jgi:carbonic anhydrase